ncbi:hypothetical protein [Actinacidiphila glaucinigra]|uniref:hypothetical protein n=1 Tax=Actinacidiphila glaucinigra TaxID=235986 RepID=UPI0035DAFC7E
MEEIGWDPALHSPVTRAMLRVGAVAVVAGLVAGPASAVSATWVPLSRAAVEAELDAAAEQAGVRRAEYTAMGLVVTADNESDRPSEDCMLAWAAAEGAGGREYAAVTAVLREHGWTELRREDSPGGDTYVNLGKGGWTATVAYDRGPGSFTVLTFTAMAHAC